MLSAWFDGWRRVFDARTVAAGVFLVTLAAAVPPAIVLRSTLQTHLGRSLEADEAADGVNFDWWQEFAVGASGLGATFSPSVIGFAATLDSIGSVLDGQREIPPVAIAVGIYLLTWTFLSGGILDRYARQRPTHAHGFFARCGVFFFRFLRLGVLAALAYWFLFAYVHGWLFDDLFGVATRRLSVERYALTWRLALYAAFGALLFVVNIVFDYAKVRAVVEDRSSMIGALTAALSFLVRHPSRAAALYGANTATFLVVVTAWALLAPGAGGAGASMWLGLLAGQLYLFVRLLLKLQFLASQTALFQRQLAHASYTAAPVPTWPESPAAELIA